MDSGTSTRIGGNFLPCLFTLSAQKPTEKAKDGGQGAPLTKPKPALEEEDYLNYIALIIILAIMSHKHLVIIMADENHSLPRISNPA